MKIEFVRNFFLIVAVFSFVVMGKTYTLDDMLAMATEEPVLTEFEKEMSVDKKTFNGIFGIDGIEFRIKNTGFDEEDFEYSLRIKPKAFGESRASSKFNSTILDNNEFKRKMLFNTTIFERYLIFAYLIEYRTLHSYYKDLITIYDDRIGVMERLTHSEDFQLEKLVKEEKDRAKEWITCKEIEKYIDVYGEYAKICLKDTSFTEFDTSGLVTIETIIERIENMNFVLDTNNAYLNYYRSKLDLERARFELEKTEKHRYLDMINFEYDNKEMAEQMRNRNNNSDYDYKSAFGIELSFQLPDLTKSASDFNHRKSGLLSEVEKYNRTKSELNAKVKKDRADLQQLIAQYEYLQLRTAEVDAEASLKKFLQIEGMDPLVYLDVKENIVKNKIEMAQIRFAILRNYMFVIDNSGKLSEMPIRNIYSEENGIVNK